MAQLKNIYAFPEMFQIILTKKKRTPSKPASVESKNSSSGMMGGKKKGPNTE